MLKEKTFIPSEYNTRLNLKDLQSGKVYNIAFDKAKEQADVVVYGKDGYYLAGLSKFYNDYTLENWIKWQEALSSDKTLKVIMAY